MKNIKLQELDKKLIRILYKFQYAPADILALLTDEPIKSIRRRCISLADAGILGREYLAGGVLACNYLKQKGMRLLDLPLRKVQIPSLYSYEHTIGEINVYTFLSLHPNTNVKLGDIISERDILNSAVYDDVGFDSRGHKLVKAREISIGIHRPDGYVIRENDGKKKYIALEFERSRKSARSTTQMLDNIQSNAKYFSKQYWFYEGKQICNKLDRYNSEKYTLKKYDYSFILDWLEKKKESLPTSLSSAGEREPIDYLGEFQTPVPLSELPTEHVELER